MLPDVCRENGMRPLRAEAGSYHLTAEEVSTQKTASLFRIGGPVLTRKP